MRRTFYLVLVICCIFGCHYDLITPKEQTMSAITETSVRTGIYLEKRGSLPQNIDQLLRRDGYLNRTTDGWGNPLIYLVDGDRLTIKSLGKDGISGGVGEDADVERRYYVEHGKLEEETSFNHTAQKSDEAK